MNFKNKTFPPVKNNLEHQIQTSDEKKDNNSIKMSNNSKEIVKSKKKKECLLWNDSYTIKNISYPEEIIKHPKEVLSFIKKSITKKKVTDNILTFDPIIYMLLEAKYINDKRVCIFINGVKKDSSLITINRALDACVKPLCQLNALFA